MISKLKWWLAWIVLSTALTATEPETWRNHMTELTSRPVQMVTTEDLLLLEADARLAVPYFYGLRPSEYEENQKLIQHAVSYLVSAELLPRDGQFRLALGRAYVALASLRWLPAYGRQPVAHPPEDPGFARQAPAMAAVRPAHREVAQQLSRRYEQAVGQATLAWQAAIERRRILRQQGVPLPAKTETSVARLQLHTDLALNALLKHNWAEARLCMERIETESSRIHSLTGI